MLKVIRDVGDEIVVEFDVGNTAQSPYSVLLNCVHASWPDLDPLKQVFIDPVSCSRVKNDSRLHEIITRQQPSSTPGAVEDDIATKETKNDAESDPAVFLYDIRIISPLFVVQPVQPQLYRLTAPIPNSPARRLVKSPYKAAAVAAVFKQDLDAAQAIVTVCKSRNEACSSYMKRFDNMRAAVDVSYSTLASRLKSLESIFLKLKVPTLKKIDTFNALSEMFPQFLDVMKNMKLPEVVRDYILKKNANLQSICDANGGVLSLIDLIPSKELTVYVKRSMDYARGLTNEIGRLEEQIAGLRRELGPFHKKLLDFEPEMKQHTDRLNNILEQGEREFREINKAEAEFDHDYTSAKDTSPDDEMDVDQTIQEHEMTLSLLSQWEANSSSRHQEFGSVHSLMLNWLVNRLRMVSTFDGKVSFCFKQMKGVETSSFSLNEAVVQLQCAKRMPQAYVRYEQELIRRTQFRAELDEELARVQSSLREMCNNEIARRKEFQMSCVQYLPKALQDGIYSLPPMIDAFQLDPFDQGLPSMTKDDAVVVKDDLLLFTTSDDLSSSHSKSSESAPKDG